MENIKTLFQNCEKPVSKIGGNLRTDGFKIWYFPEDSQDPERLELMSDNFPKNNFDDDMLVSRNPHQDKSILDTWLTKKEFMEILERYYQDVLEDSDKEEIQELIDSVENKPEGYFMVSLLQVTQSDDLGEIGSLLNPSQYFISPFTVESNFSEWLSFPSNNGGEEFYGAIRADQNFNFDETLVDKITSFEKCLIPYVIFDSTKTQQTNLVLFSTFA